MGFRVSEAYSLPTNAKSLVGSVMTNLCWSHYPLHMAMVRHPVRGCWLTKPSRYPSKYTWLKCRSTHTDYWGKSKELCRRTKERIWVRSGGGTLELRKRKHEWFWETKHDRESDELCPSDGRKWRNIREDDRVWISARSFGRTKPPEYQPDTWRTPMPLPSNLEAFEPLLYMGLGRNSDSRINRKSPFLWCARCSRCEGSKKIWRKIESRGHLRRNQYMPLTTTWGLSCLRLRAKYSLYLRRWGTCGVV